MVRISYNHYATMQSATMQSIQHPWLRSYPPELNWNEEIEPKPIYDILHFAVDKFPNHPGIDFLGKILSYQELGKLADKFALALGNVSGKKIGIYMPNCPQFVIAYFGILKAGGCVVNYSPLYSASELEYQINDSDTEILITLDLNLLYPKAEELLKKSIQNGGKLKKIIVSKFSEYLSFPKNILFGILKSKDIAKPKYDSNILKWAEFLNISDVQQNYSQPVNVEDTAIIQYTGGTTGVPKGAELSHKNVYVNAVQCKLWCKNVPDGEGSVLTILPLFHVFAMTTCMNFGILTASKLILHPRFEIEKVLKDLNDKKPTAMPGVATMYNAINNYKDINSYDLSSLKVCVSGGGALPVEIKRKFENLTGCTLIEGYGLTETSPVVCANPVEGLNKEGSIGLPFPQTEVLIEDIENRGNFLGVDQIGELCVKAPQVMKGYYKRKQATDEVIIDGILRTGDIAKIDVDGYIFITDRLKEMIICGGFKVYPRHLEEILYQHPAILECAVIGIHDDYSGQKVKAVIALKKGCSLTKEKILEYLKDKVAKHEMPKEIEFRDSLPKSPVGKILKKELK